MKTIAIIGASSGQKVLYLKAKEMGLKVVGFAWDKGCLENHMYDEFYEISVTDTGSIVDICKKIRVDGVITNASEFLIPLASKIAEKLGLICTPYETIKNIQNKENVREITQGILGLSNPSYYIYPYKNFTSFPCVVKPVKGAAKRGVSYCENECALLKAIEYAGGIDNKILVEEYIPGREISVESLSYKGKHEVVQITDKESSGPPHFVELGHHQPSGILPKNKERIKECVSLILDKVGFKNGATHIEMKIDEQSDKLYLIEINCRGGGDHISDSLVKLSTNCDYIKEMINIALGRYTPRKIQDTGYSGICYLCNQSKHLLKYFGDKTPEWLLIREWTNNTLSNSTTNYDRDGYFIYAADKKPNI